MSVDLNKVREKLKNRQQLGVNRSGQLNERNPDNDGTRQGSEGYTTLSPKRFF